MVIEPSRFGLENLIVGNRRLQGFVKQRREISIAGHDRAIAVTSAVAGVVGSADDVPAA